VYTAQLARLLFAANSFDLISNYEVAA
jgi:hypothetical protein